MKNKMESLKLDDESKKKSSIFEIGIFTSIIVIGVGLVILATLNSIQWHIKNLWGHSGSFWNGMWFFFHEKNASSPLSFLLVGMAFSSHLPFVLMNIPLLIIDIFECPRWLFCYKIQPYKRLNLKKLSKLIGRIFFNQLVIGSIMGYMCARVLLWRSPTTVSITIPSFERFVFDFLVFMLIEEVLFYYGHRMAHHPLLYKHVHKIHHEWKTPIGLTCVYAHPLEHIFVNVLPVMMGPVVTGAHSSVLFLWLTISIMSTIISHCGYHFPFLPSPEAHDYHHLNFSNNYGVMGILDKLHGTDNDFKESKQYKYHYVSLCLEPIDRSKMEKISHI